MFFTQPKDPMVRKFKVCFQTCSLQNYIQNSVNHLVVYAAQNPDLPMN